MNLLSACVVCRGPPPENCIPICLGQLDFSRGRTVFAVAYLSLSFTKLCNSGSCCSLANRLLYSEGLTFNCRDGSAECWRCLIKCSTSETGDFGLSVDSNSSVAGGVKGNRICLSGGVPSADSGTVGVETENLSSLIAWLVLSFDVCVALLMREAVRLSDTCSLCGNLYRD